MSTLSFQDYVRERMANRKTEASAGPEIKIPTFPSEIRIPSASEQAEQRISHFAQRAQVPSSAVQSIATTKSASAALSTPFSTPLSGQTGSPRANLSAGIATRPSPASAAPKTTAPTIANFDLAQELSAMKDMIEDRFNTLNWLGMARQNPIQSTLMVKLIRAGYSPMLARTILERIPEGTTAQNALQMVMNVLERNLQLDTRTLPEEGGFFAMIGATGVGKTTTIAKIAGICAQKYGASSLGLITLDTQRVGAQEQLRSHGKLLGTVTHVAHDRYALQELLNLLSNKRLVLIDTGGLAPRDPRKRDMMDLLDLPNIKRMLVLNAGGHGDTLDDTVAHFKGNTPQHVIFSKLDEAVKLGTVMDAAIRHRLILRGVTTGQQIPEDWESPNSRKLVLTSMIGTGKSPFDPKVADLSFMFSQGNNRPDARNHLNA
jgi:flagellar biosynthesis protein FlhF